MALSIALRPFGGLIWLVCRGDTFRRDGVLSAHRIAYIAGERV